MEESTTSLRQHHTPQKISMLARLVTRRLLSTKQFPFKDLDATDDQYKELNNFYSDLFTAPRESAQTTTAASKDELTQLNEEMAELYGTLESPLTLLDQIKQNKPMCIISKSNNPFKNLALEDYIFQNTPLSQSFNAQRLIFYTNSPCVVIGKNQNPWKEVNLNVLNSLGVPLLRRRSGGGTVVHDLRNVNYSYITTRQEFDRMFFGSVIVDALKMEKLTQNERGDLLFDGKKVSGSAFKISKGKSYHHGTMLLGSKLDVLSALLNTKQRDVNVEFRCSGVDSVPAPVTNVGMENEEFVELVGGKFGEMFQCDDVLVVEEGEMPQEVLDTAQELENWNWRFGNTPKFELDIKHKDFTVTFRVEKGYLKSFTVDRMVEQFQYLHQVLKDEPIKFVGSEICGFILNEEYGEYIGRHIDGTD